MFDKVMLTPSEKIKRLRKKIGATQSDIAGTGVTRNTICQIEKEKIKLTRETAGIIANNINAIAIQKGYDTKITSEYLLEDEYIQAGRIAKIYESELKLLKIKNYTVEEFESKLREIDDFINAYEFDYNLRINLLGLISDMCKLKKLNDKYYVYALQCKDVCIANREYSLAVEWSLQIMKFYYSQMNYDVCINLCKYTLDIISRYTIKDETLHKKIYFNMALVYRKLNDIDSCLFYINKLLTEYSFNIRQEIDIKLMQANCLDDLEQYEEAYKIYNEALKKAIDDEYAANITRIYGSLAELCFDTGKYSEAEYYAEQSLSIEYKVSEEISIQIKCCYINTFTKLKKINSIEKYLKEAIHGCFIIGDIRRQNIMLHNVIDFYISLGNERNIINLLNILMAEVESGNLSNPRINEIFVKAFMYFENKSKIKANEIQNKIIKIITIYQKMDKK